MGKWKKFCAAGVLFCLVAAVILWWVRMPISDQELLANFAKAGDFFRGVQSVGGLPWWSPSFLQGTSLAMAWGYMLSNPVLLATALLAGSNLASYRPLQTFRKKQASFLTYPQPFPFSVF
jgi:hypothetical protein